MSNTRHLDCMHSNTLDNRYIRINFHNFTIYLSSLLDMVSNDTNTYNLHKKKKKCRLNHDHVKFFNKYNSIIK